MTWALWEIDECEAALEELLKISPLRPSAHRMVAVVYACLGEVDKAQEAYQIFYTQAEEPTISEQRAAWKGFWTGPGLERWLEHMRVAGMKD
jgi:DNA-binding SARP family transcriptional activator